MKLKIFLFKKHWNLGYLKNCRRMARGKSNRVIEHFEDNYQQSAWKALGLLRHRIINMIVRTLLYINIEVLIYVEAKLLVTYHINQRKTKHILFNICRYNITDIYFSLPGFIRRQLTTISWPIWHRTPHHQCTLIKKVVDEIRKMSIFISIFPIPKF